MKTYVLTLTEEQAGIVGSCLKQREQELLASIHAVQKPSLAEFDKAQLNKVRDAYQALDSCPEVQS